MSDTIRQRLEAAGLFLPLPSGDLSQAPSLVRLFGIRALLAPSATRPARVSFEEKRFAALASAAGLGSARATDNTGGLLACLPLPAGTTASQVLRRAIQAGEAAKEELLAVARQTDDPSTVDLFLDGLGAEDYDQRMESLLGLVRWNCKEAVPQVLACLNHSRPEVAVHALYALERLGALRELADNGALDSFAEGEHGDLIQGLLELAMEGDPSPLPELMDEGNWSMRVSIFRLVRAVAETRTSPELFEFLMRHGEEESDNDAAMAWSWALSAAAMPGDFSAAEAMLDMAEGLQEGGYAQCATLAVLGRLRLQPDQKRELAERLLSLDPSDNDAQAAVRMAIVRLQPSLLGRAPATDARLMIPGYSRLEDFYGDGGGEVASEHAISRPPSPAVAAFFEPADPSSAELLMAALRRDEASLAIMNLMAACLVSYHPRVLPLLDSLVLDKGKATDLRRAAASALLAADQPLRASPALLRCLVGADVGGPLAADPHVFGQLLGLIDDSDCDEAAGALLSAGPYEFRAVAAGMFDARKAIDPSGSSGDYNRFRGRLGVPLAPLPDVPPIDPLLAMAAGLEVSATEFLPVLRSDPHGGRRAYVAFLTELRDRETQLAMARDTRLLEQFDDEALAEIWLQLAGRDHWLPKECAANMARAVGERLMATEPSEQIGARLMELCDDDDSDVSGVSSQVCEQLGLS